MQALILSGGLGTRLRPLTLYTPKPLLPVVNAPFLSYPLGLLRKHGIQEAILCTSDSSPPYRDFIQSQKRLGTTVFCSREQRELGTAGGLKNAERFIHSSRCFVFNGDVLTDMDLTEMLKFHRQKESLITIALIQVLDPSAWGLVLTQPSGRVTNFIEKPSAAYLKSHQKQQWINAGIYIFERDVLSLIPPNRKYSVERDLFPDCLTKGFPMYAFRVRETTYWNDMGTPQKYLQVNGDVLSKRLYRLLNPRKLARFGKGSMIHKTARIGKDVVLGNGCKVGMRCSIVNSVLMQGVKVESDVTLENCIIGSQCKIGHHTIVKETKVIGNRSTLSPFSQL